MKNNKKCKTFLSITTNKQFKFNQLITFIDHVFIAITYTGPLNLRERVHAYVSVCFSRLFRAHLRSGKLSSVSCYGGRTAIASDQTSNGNTGNTVLPVPVLTNFAKIITGIYTHIANNSQKWLVANFNIPTLMCVIMYAPGEVLTLLISVWVHDFINWSLSNKFSSIRLAGSNNLSLYKNCVTKTS